MQQLFFQQQTPSVVLVCNGPNGFHLTFHVQDTFLAQSELTAEPGGQNIFFLTALYSTRAGELSRDQYMGTWGTSYQLQQAQHSQLLSYQVKGLSSSFLVPPPSYGSSESQKDRLKLEESQRRILSILKFDSTVSKVRQLTPAGWFKRVEISTWSIS